jgi:hypothetical protein
MDAGRKSTREPYEQRTRTLQNTQLKIKTKLPKYVSAVMKTVAAPLKETKTESQAPAVVKSKTETDPLWASHED